MVGSTYIGVERSSLNMIPLVLGQVNFLQLLNKKKIETPNVSILYQKSKVKLNSKFLRNNY